MLIHLRHQPRKNLQESTSLWHTTLNIILFQIGRRLALRQMIAPHQPLTHLFKRFPKVTAGCYQIANAIFTFFFKGLQRLLALFDSFQSLLTLLLKGLQRLLMLILTAFTRPFSFIFSIARYMSLCSFCLGSDKSPCFFPNTCKPLLDRGKQSNIILFQIGGRLALRQMIAHHQQLACFF